MGKVKSEEERGEVSSLQLNLRQLLTVLGPLMGVLVSGMTSGYSAVLLPQLKASASLNVSEPSANFTETNDITVSTTEEESWIASASVLTMAPGCWLAGLVMETLGRRKSTLFLLPVFLIGWLIIGFASNFVCIIIGRLICGLCVGLLGPLVPVYISETSDPQLRGTLLGGITLALTIGILLVHAIGTLFHWRTTAYVCSAFPFACWLLSLFSRESPTWLLNKGRTEEARESWIYLRGENSMQEYSLLESHKVEESEKGSTFSALKEALSSRYFLKPLGITCLFFFTAQFAGYNVVVFYSVGMLAEVTGPENAYLGTLIVDFIRVFFSGLLCYLVKRCKRRTLSFMSGFGTAIVLLSLSLLLLLDVGKPWLPVLLLVLYTAVLQLGLAALPWMLCGELFLRKYRGLGSGFTSGFCFMCFFAVVKMAPSMFELLEPHGVFAVYGAVTLFGMGLLYPILPETKNKTLEDIERTFDKKSGKSEPQIVERWTAKFTPPEKEPV